jgi:hypothetical protein
MTENLRHGKAGAIPLGELVENWYPDDPDLLMAHVDMATYIAARPECVCDAGCSCDDEYIEEEDEDGDS